MNFRIKKHSAVLIITICLLIGFGTFDTAAPEGPVSEYQVKAAFLYNFIKFVEWPEDAFGSPEAPIVIGIVGGDPLGEDLDKLVKDKTIRRRVVEVRRFKRGSALNACHVLFIAQSEKINVTTIVKEIEKKPVLTVSEITGFLENGGAINFVTKSNKVRFEINLDASTEAGLKISSKILSLALRVVGSTNGENHD